MARRETLAGLRAAAGDAEAQAEVAADYTVRQAERTATKLEAGAAAAKDGALLQLLKGEITGDEYSAVTTGGAAAGAAQRAEAGGLRQAREDEAAAKVAAEAHAAKMRGVKKTKPKRPVKVGTHLRQCPPQQQRPDIPSRWWWSLPLRLLLG